MSPRFFASDSDIDALILKRGIENPGVLIVVRNAQHEGKFRLVHAVSKAVSLAVVFEFPVGGDIFEKLVVGGDGESTVFFPRCEVLDAGIRTVLGVVAEKLNLDAVDDLSLQIHDILLCDALSILQQKRESLI